MAIGCNGNGGQNLFRYYGNVLSITQSGPTSDGYLSSEDWNRFNGAASGLVTSVFGRTGDVVAQAGDYVLNQISPPTANWTLVNQLRIKATGELQLWNPDQSKWHTLQVRGLAGGEYITIGAGEL